MREPVGPAVQLIMPYGCRDQLPVHREVVFGKAERGDGQRRLRLVEDAHDDLLAEILRRGGDAQVDVHFLPREVLEDDTAVLRQAFLGDVEVRHHLEARDEGVGDGAGQVELFEADAVDAVTDQKAFLHRLDMDVGRAADEGVLDDARGELDDGRGFLVGRLARLELFRGVGAAELRADDADDLAHVHRMRRLSALAREVFFEDFLEERRGDDGDLLDGEFGRTREGLLAVVVERVGHEHGDRARREPFVRDDALAPDDLFTDRLDQRRVDLDVLLPRDERHSGEARDERRHIRVVDLELRVLHALDERRGVLRDLLHDLQVLLRELAKRGARLLVQHLDRADGFAVGGQGPR